MNKFNWADWDEMETSLGSKVLVDTEQIVAVMCIDSQKELYQISFSNGHTYAVKDNEVIRQMRLSVKAKPQ